MPLSRVRDRPQWSHAGTSLVLLWLVLGAGPPLRAQETSIAGRVSWGSSRPWYWAPPRVEVVTGAGQVIGAFTPTSQDGATSFQYSLPLPAGTYYVRTSSPASANWSGPFCRVSGEFVQELYDDVVCVAPDCMPTAGRPVVVAPGATTSGIDFQLDEGGMIRASVSGGFSYRNGIRVYDSRGVLLPDRVTYFSCIPFGGDLAVGLPTGAYYVRTENDQGLVDQLYGFGPCVECPVTAGKPLFVREGESVSIDFALTEGAAIAGTVRDRVTALPLPGVTLEVFGPGGVATGSAVTDSLGVYRVSGLVPGTYYARTRNQIGYVDRLYGGTACADCGVMQGTPIVVPSSGDATGIDFDLDPGVGIAGKVGDAVGAALSGSVGVSLFDTGGHLAGRTSSSADQWAISLPPGTYFARTDALAGYVRELYRDRPCPGPSCTVTSGAPITATSAPVSGIDFSLESCETLSLLPASLGANGAVALGRPYRQVLTATGGATPYRYFIESGALPPGLQLDPVSGVLSGSASVTGAYPFVVGVVDAIGCAGTQAYRLDALPCALSLSRTEVGVASGGGTGRVEVSGNCTWDAESNDAWIVLRGTSTGSGTVELQVESNPSATQFRIGSVRVGNRVVTVRQAPTTSAPPFGFVDTPVDDTAGVTGAIAVTGWALDDLEVSKVEIYRDPVSGEPTRPNGKVFVGDGTFVEGARPDVAAVYSRYPLRTRAGWGYMLLTNMFPGQGNGPFTLYAYAYDVDGHGTLLGSKTITCTNATATKPFGTIDTPGQGETVSGTIVNFGWALTPLPAMIPIDGSTMTVLIDGVVVGKPTYNQYRSDIATLFSGYANSDGAVGYYFLDTTKLTNGIHTIMWVVVDDQGRADGIGSRYFWVQN